MKAANRAANLRSIISSCCLHIALITSVVDTIINLSIFDVEHTATTADYHVDGAPKIPHVGEKARQTKKNDESAVEARVLLVLMSGAGHITTTTTNIISRHKITSHIPHFDNNTQTAARKWAAWARSPNTRLPRSCCSKCSPKIFLFWRYFWKEKCSKIVW